MFAKEVYAWASENPPDRRKPLGCYYNPDTNTLRYLSHSSMRLRVLWGVWVSVFILYNRPYEAQPADFVATDLPSEPMLRTVDVQSNLGLIIPCIRSIKCNPLLIPSHLTAVSYPLLSFASIRYYYHFDRVGYGAVHFGGARGLWEKHVIEELLLATPFDHRRNYSL